MAGTSEISNAGIKLGTGSTIAIGNNFSVDASGNLTARNGTFTGTVNASTTSSVTATMTVGSGSTTITIDGINGSIVAGGTTLSVDGLIMNEGSIHLGGGVFSVNDAGQLTARSANIRGHIQVESATILGNMTTSSATITPTGIAIW